MKMADLFCLAISMFAANALVAGGGIICASSMAQPSSIVPQQNRSRLNQTDGPIAPAINKAGVVEFINANRPRNLMKISSVDVVDFGQAKTGGGNSDLFVLFDFSGRGYANRLWIYNRNDAGSWKMQEIEGWKMGPFKQMVRDLDGDGKDEVIISEAIGPGGVWYPLMAMPAWPAVYRIKDGRYVETSRDFTSYYDNEVLPQLEKSITAMHMNAPAGNAYVDAAARDLVEKNKILRVLGRNPTAGLNHAYQWMNSDDPQLMQCAIATFADIGGHEKEVRQLQKALPAAVKGEIGARKGD